MIIAIDGPAGSGKSSVAKLVAKKLGYFYINSGRMYRALAWTVLKKGIAPQGENSVVDIAKKINWEFKETDDSCFEIYIDSKKLDSSVYSDEVSRVSSIIAKYPEVRKILNSKQRELAASKNVVMEGRDIATVVFPNAEFKIFLDASAEKRAERRVNQLRGKGLPADYDEIYSSIVKRDTADKTRKLAPLVITKDSTYLDTSEMSLDEVVSKVLEIVKNKS
jgi:CMP/dCMP kinase